MVPLRMVRFFSVTPSPDSTTSSTRFRSSPSMMVRPGPAPTMVSFTPVSRSMSKSPPTFSSSLSSNGNTSNGTSVSGSWIL